MTEKAAKNAAFFIYVNACISAYGKLIAIFYEIMHAISKRIIIFAPTKQMSYETLPRHQRAV